MKNLYKCFFAVAFSINLLAPVLAQGPFLIGKSSEVVALYKTKANAKATNPNGNKNKIQYVIPGHGSLVLTINGSRKEQNADVFFGHVENKNNNFFLKASENKLSGYIILEDQKKAYEYTYTNDGDTFLKEVDINKVLCVDYEKKISKSNSQDTQVGSIMGATVPDLQSLPGASAVVLLDFDGQNVYSPYWNNGETIDASPANLSETQILEAWNIISEDFYPFDLNITTNESVYFNAPPTKRMRVIFTPTNYWRPNSGGVAYYNSFIWGNDTPCWVFNGGAGTAAAETGSHEIGHTLGLRHDGRISPSEEYYSGHNYWAPIMGVSFYKKIKQWSKGEYLSANNLEDDVNIMATKNGFGFRPDDHSNSSYGATPIVIDPAGNISASSNKGIITTSSDIDVFSFTSNNHAVSILVNPNPFLPNLDIQLTLKNSSGETIVIADFPDLAASINQTLPTGTYYLYIDGTKGNFGADSDYSSIGEYSITGNFTFDNKAPVLTSIGNKTLTLGQTVTFTAKATDTDIPVQTLTFSFAGSAPAGANINPSTGVFNWTPSQVGSYALTIKVTDSGFPAQYSQETITVTVTPAAIFTALRVNAGGNLFATADARKFVSDLYFSGGSASTPISQEVAGTADDYLYQTGRHGTSFSYNFPTGNGNYDVVLHFAETYYGNTASGGIGSRKFHVNMEGVRKLTDYDVFARAGGALKVAQETFRVNVSDGTLNVAFLKGSADNPAVKAIEVLPAGSGLTINAGGTAFTSSTGRKFSADSYYAAGSISSIGSGDILNTTDDELYRNGRVGVFSYGLPSGNGTFDVTLHFAETYYGSRAAGGIGSRKFNVYAENVKRLSDYDIFAKAGGSMRAVKETMRVTVNDGVLNLYFAKGTADNPAVSAIEVIQVVNRAPVLASIGEQTIDNGQILTFTASATDPDGNSLTYSLVEVPEMPQFPGGAIINSATGVFSWKPTEHGLYTVGVKVTDNGSPALTSQEDITICVGPRRDLRVVGTTICNAPDVVTGYSGTITIKNSEVGVSYVLMSRDDARLSSWEQEGNGGDLVFDISFEGGGYDRGVYTFDPKVYATCTESTYLESAYIEFLPPLSLPIASGKTVTSGQTATLTAVSSDAEVSYKWYSTLTGGSPLFTGSSFTTPALFATTSYYVSAANGSCESNRTKVTVTVSGVVASAAIRVNAGGNPFLTADARSFTVDAYFSGGVVSTPTTAGIAGTVDDYLYQTGRHGSSFSYNFPTGNGSYDVVLHFAETYYGAAAAGGVGSRKFHVNMEGVRKLTDYDVFAKAGGALRVAQETFRVNVNDGTLNIAFLKGAADNPAVKAIEVLPAGAALTINSGGSAFTSSAGKRFSADSYYASGSVSSIASGEIANTADDGLYRNARSGVFSYGLPSGNGTFDVVLHFAETYWGSRASGGVGSRKFNVYLENVKRLSDYDVFAKAGGAMRAVRETIRVTVTDGVLNLYFAKGTADNPIVSAIEVMRVTTSARLAAAEEPTKDLQVNLYPNPVQDKLTVQLPFSTDQVKATTVTDATGTDCLLNAHTLRGKDQLEIRVETLQRGLYFLKIDTREGYEIKKFLKK